ncbi:hypothetical protein [Aureispira anguillae]|uniref:Uncharacterized protein n=1 Tax=Aureispira anguillae TaxID=2864201 RepID=A0A915YL24_9BACT|nr:hypothetical protein [Aureispira anguillae]BDS15178.1 hypothetical protein AsAng_0059620 [Aureispira anguillae]
MQLQEKTLVLGALLNAYLIFFFLIICNYGGLHLTTPTRDFLDFYTLVILVLILLPVLGFILKWILRQELNDKNLVFVLAILLLILLGIYYSNSY